jgi:hypothetical protein
MEVRGGGRRGQFEGATPLHSRTGTMKKHEEPLVRNGKIAEFRNMYPVSVERHLSMWTQITDTLSLVVFLIATI